MFGTRFGWGFGLAGLLVIALAAAGIGYLAYSAGVAEGVAQAAELPEAELGRVAPFYYAPYAFRPLGAGFSFLGCLVPLLLLFLLFGGMRLLFAPWGMGPWGRGWGRSRKDPERWQHFREQAEQWHREMHEAEERGGDRADA